MNKQDFKILIVDDLTYIRLLIRNILKDMGFEYIDEAADGVEALKKAGMFKPDLIVLDIFLPKIDGINLIDLFRHLNPYIRILMCTVSHDNLVLQKAMEKGAIDFVNKPINKNDFIKKINLCIDFDTRKQQKSKYTLSADQSYDFSEKIGIKLDRYNSLQILNLYGDFGEEEFKDLKETINSLRMYKYSNIILNLNGVNQFNIDVEKMKTIKELTLEGGFKIIIIKPKLIEMFKKGGFTEIKKTELEAVKEIKEFIQGG